MMITTNSLLGGFAILLGCFCLSCSQQENVTQLTEAQQQLNMARDSIKNLSMPQHDKGQLVHLVLLKLKADADVEVLAGELNKLQVIEEVQAFSLGAFEEVGDKRALSEYAFSMQLRFENVAAYRRYQQDTLHLGVKKRTLKFLAGPPSSYDYIID